MAFAQNKGKEYICKKDKRMAKKSHNDVLQMIKQIVSDTEPNAEVFLFGSRARGDARADSDWDILILVDTPKVSDEQFENLNYNIWLKGLEMGEEINPLVYPREKWYESQSTSMFRRNVIEEGVRL